MIQLKTSKPKMIRFLNISLLGGLITKAVAKVSTTVEKKVIVEVTDKSLQTVIMWAKFKDGYFPKMTYDNGETLQISDSIHKAIKKIGASDITLEENNQLVTAAGTSFKYEESEQDLKFSEIDVEELSSDDETQTYFRPKMIDTSADVLEFQVFTDTEELRKLPQADKYTFVLDKGELKVVTEDVGKLEIDINCSSTSAEGDLDLKYTKSFSGDIFDKLISNLDGKVVIEFSQKFLILSQSNKEVDLMYAQASLVDSSTVTV